MFVNGYVLRKRILCTNLFVKRTDSYRFVLVCIDCFSKYAWVRPLKNKTRPVVTRAFRDILDEGRVPKYLHTDHGTEYLNASFRNLMQQYNIHFFTANTDTKASIAERFFRTLKQRIYRYFMANNTPYKIWFLRTITVIIARLKKFRPTLPERTNIE